MQKYHETGEKQKRAFLIYILNNTEKKNENRFLPERNLSELNEVSELQGLAESLGLEIAGQEIIKIREKQAKFGIGSGKAAEVPDAIKKAIEDAKKNLIAVPIVGTTVPHEYVGKFGAASVLIKPGSEGSGIIAGGSVRPILELAGYRDIKTKVIGTNNPRNVGYATINALQNMVTAQDVAQKRGKKVEEIL